MKTNAYIVIGIALMLFGVFYQGMVTVNVDTTPPVIGYSIPDDGKVYAKIDKLYVECYDTDSGIDNVYVWVDGVQYILEYVGKEPQSPWEMWEKQLATPIEANGSHHFNIQVTNKATLTNTKSGDFTIADPLNGQWYINTFQITSSSQTIYIPTNTLTFKFVKQSNVPDEYVTCQVDYSGPASGTISLEQTSTGVWTATQTFSDGSYTMTLTASDGRTTVQYSLIKWSIGVTENETQNNEQPEIVYVPLPQEVYGIPMSFILIAGGGCLAVWGMFKVKPKKEA